MKALKVGLVVASAVLRVAACTGLFGGPDGGSSGQKGLVAFSDNPKYDSTTEEVYFRASLQYDTAGGGQAADIEYQILDGDTVVASGSGAADTYDSYFQTWGTQEIRVPVSQATYGGKTLTIFLDPEAKLTSSTWLNPSLDGRKKNITIP
jgi:hypothetical protein